MLAILDPALFWVSGTDTPLSQEEEETLRVHLDNANRIIKQYRCDIPTPDWYWRKLQLEMVKPLSLRLRGPHVKRALAELCRCPPSSHNEEPQVPASVRMWHVKPLFQCRYLSDTWIPIMEQLLLYCINKKEKIIFIIL